MIITCPSCHTRYNLNPASLGRTGRTVRCSGCGELWFIEAPHEAADPPPVPSVPLRPTGASTAGGRSGSWGWRVVTPLLLLLAALVLGRNEIAAHLPEAAPVYQRLGLPVELALGIEFRKLASQQRREGDDRALVVTGEIANVSGRTRAVPAIRIGLIDAQGREIDHALFDAPKPSLGADAVEGFEVTLGGLPPEARDFSVSFAPTP